MKDTRDMMVKDYDTCTDEELIARLRAGERQITDYLIDKYKSLVGPGRGRCTWWAEITRI